MLPFGLCLCVRHEAGLKLTFCVARQALTLDPTYTFPSAGIMGMYYHRFQPPVGFDMAYGVGRIQTCL